MNTLLERLSSDNLIKYLSLKGWACSRIGSERRITQCITPDGQDSVLIPNDKVFVDYQKGLERALEVIAHYEGLTLKHLYNKLLYQSSDLLRWHISDKMTEGGVIPFNSMISNIEDIKDLLGSTYQDILSPSIFHPKVYTKDVMEQISKYRFGQTEVGSYILNIVCPLGFYQYDLFDIELEKLPISRQINHRLLENINSIQVSVEENSSEMSDKVESGAISVNFLNSLSELYEENKDSEVAIIVDWCKDIPLLEQAISHVILNPSCIDKVMTVVEKYSPKQEQNVPIHYFGKIVNIGAEAEVGNRDTVDIKFATIGENMRTITVTATLNYAKYFNIVEQAFQTGADIKVSGIKSSTAKSIRLDSATIEMA